MQQTDNENTQTYQVKVVILIYHQILMTNLQGHLQQVERRVNNQILGIKGLIYSMFTIPAERLLQLCYLGNSSCKRKYVRKF